MTDDEFIPTRRTLLSRLKNRDDQESWKEFFDIYARSIYRVAVKAGEAFGFFWRRSSQLSEVKCSPVIVLLHRVSDSFQLGRGMIELARDLDLQFGMSRDRVIIDRDPTIGSNEFAIFRQHEWINFERPRFNAARGCEEFSNRFGKLLRLVLGKVGRRDSFVECRIYRSGSYVARDSPR